MAAFSKVRSTMMEASALRCPLNPERLPKLCFKDLWHMYKCDDDMFQVSALISTNEAIKKGMR
jgi:hypothetical protein